jgi:hypothetical protein
LPSIRFTKIEITGEFETAQELAAIATQAFEAFGLSQRTPLLVKAPALKDPPNEYTTAEEVESAKPRKTLPAARNKPKTARPVVHIANDQLSFGEGIRRALKNSSRPLTVDEIATWCERHGMPHIDKGAVSRNVYALRHIGHIRRTPGTDGLGPGVTWELVSANAQQPGASDPAEKSGNAR